MVSRPVLIVVVVAMIAAAASGVAFHLVQANGSAKPQMSDEQRITREKFFGKAEEPTSIENGQEMRPRW